MQRIDLNIIQSGCFYTKTLGCLASLMHPARRTTILIGLRFTILFDLVEHLKAPSSKGLNLNENEIHR